MQRAQWGLFGTISLAALALTVLYGVHLSRWPDAPDRGFTFWVDLGNRVVAQTRPLGEAAGLRAGDHILSVNGQRYETYREYLELLNLTPGGENVYEIEREGQVLAVPVPMRPLGLEIVLKP